MSFLLRGEPETRKTSGSESSSFELKHPLVDCPQVTSAFNAWILIIIISGSRKKNSGALLAS